jgi:hypothetical protein
MQNSDFFYTDETQKLYKNLSFYHRRIDNNVGTVFKITTRNITQDSRMIQAYHWNNYYSRIWPRAHFKEVPRFIQRSLLFVSVLTCVRISKNWSRVDLNARVNTNCQSGLQTYNIR